MLANPNGTAPGQYPRTRREGHRAAAWSAARTAADAEPAVRGIARARPGRARAHLTGPVCSSPAEGSRTSKRSPSRSIQHGGPKRADRNDDSRDARPNRAAPLAAVVGCRRRGRRLRDASSALAAALGADVFSVDGRPMEELVGAMLRERHLTIAAAESCTGGLMMSRLTDVPGSSGYVSEGSCSTATS